MIATLPTITRPNDIQTFLKKWQTILNPILATPPTPAAPRNFAAQNAQGGILLTWAPLTSGVSVDGYQILRSSSADFSETDATYTLPGVDQNSFFDAINVSGSQPSQTKYYKLRATAGTANNPQSVLGVLTGIVSQTTIPMNNTVTVPTTNYDTQTSDKYNTQAGRAVRLALNPKLPFRG